VIGAFLAGRWALGRMNIAGTRRAPVIAAIVVLAVVVACGTVTRARNADYVSDETLWRDAVQKQPDNHRARVYYGVALMNGGRFREAEAQFVESLRLRPSDPVALGRLGAALAAQGRFDEAIDTWEKSLALEPDDYATQRYLGEAYAQRRQDRQALRHLERALTAHPDDARLLDFVATLLADSSDPAVRDAPRALALASHAAVLTGRRDAHVLDVLAVAQAGVGQFREAAATADEALALARQQGNARLVTELEYRASAFRARAGS
jgi:tetratricopeptide (TPR) repeat protein